MTYDMIIDMVEKIKVTPPSEIELKSLQAWMNGYTECMNTVIKLLATLQARAEDNGR